MLEKAVTADSDVSEGGDSRYWGKDGDDSR
jgi:hypothetical protein